MDSCEVRRPYRHPARRASPAAGDDEPGYTLVLASGRNHPLRMMQDGRQARKIDDGWDVQRERTFARQFEFGVIPPDAELTPRRRRSACALRDMLT